MSGRLDGKVVVITGAAGEIGRATAVRFAGGGAHLVLVDLAGAPLNEVVAATKAAGSRAIAVEADVGWRPLYRELPEGRPNTEHDDADLRPGAAEPDDDEEAEA